MSEYIIRLHEVSANLKAHGAWGLAEVIDKMIRAELDEPITEECDHDLDKHNQCLLCSYDGTVEVLSGAIDRAKEIRKYGE